LQQEQEQYFFAFIGFDVFTAQEAKPQKAMPIGILGL
jgi:hypothetical protein